MPTIRGFAFVLAPLVLSAAPVPARIASDYGRVPVYFEQYSGQATSSTLFVSRGAGYSLALTKSGATLSLAGAHTLRLELIKTSKATTASGEERLEGHSNYYFGNDPQKWITGIPQFGQVRYKNVYPGVDLVWHGSQQQLEYDLILGPGADPWKDPSAIPWSGCDNGRRQWRPAAPSRWQ